MASGSEGVVLIRRRALGDVVLLGSVTSLLPKPLTVVTDPAFLELVARFRGVDRVVPFGAPVPAGRVIDLQRDLRTVWRFPRARRVRKHSVARWLRIRGFGHGRPTVPELYGRACGVAPTRPPWIDTGNAVRDALILVPGASCAPKQWSPDGFVAVGRAWDGPVWVIGGPGEERLVDDVAAAIPQARTLCERGFARTLDVLGTARVAVGGDTGLMHLAAACGARVVTLFGPTHPDDGFFPYDGEAVELALPCRPCTRHRLRVCPVVHNGCMGHDAGTVLARVKACAGSC